MNHPRIRTPKPLDPVASLAHAEELHRHGVISSLVLAGVRQRIARIHGGSGLKSTVSRRGTTTVPLAVRKALALEDGGQVEWALGDGLVVVRCVQK